MSDTNQIDVERLYVSSVDSKPITVESWTDLAGEDMDGFTYWETFDHELDDKTVQLLAVNGSTHGVVVDGELFRDWDTYQEQFWTECTACNGTGYVRSLLDMEVEPVDGETPECETCDGWGLVRTFPEALSEDDFTECLEADSYSAEGPMMNYWYPLDIREDEAEGVAAKLGSEPLCVVEVNGSYGLALTGGGMDLSWEICRAFILAGHLPPVHFSDLPAMGAYRDDIVLAAMRRSLNTKIGWCQNSLDRLDRQYPTQEDSK